MWHSQFKCSRQPAAFINVNVLLLRIMSKVQTTSQHFTVVLRAPSAVYFRPNEHLVIENFPAESGPVRIFTTTRWLQQEADRVVPGHLWVEVSGAADSIEDATSRFPNAGLALLPMLSFSCNATILEGDIELAFDSTPDIDRRAYFQNYLPPEPSQHHFGRYIDVETTARLLETLAVHGEAERIRRSINQYRIALESWRLGRETPCIAHLWMAVEALTKARLALELKARGLATKEELAASLAVDIKQLDATVRRQFILMGDVDCYKNSVRASDGFEHGFLPYNELRDLSKGVRTRMAEYVRRAILETLELDAVPSAVLTSSKFAEPLGYWPAAKYLRATIIGH